MNFFRTLLLWLFIGALVADLSGCSGRGKHRAISGEVKWRGQPLDRGGITFEPEDPGLGSGGGAMIKNGRYSIPAEHGLLPGRYRVRISSAEPTGKELDLDAPPGPAGPLPKDRIQQKSDLTAEVMADGPNVLNYEVD
jgi:hypothetical protein